MTIQIGPGISIGAGINFTGGGAPPPPPPPPPPPSDAIVLQIVTTS